MIFHHSCSCNKTIELCWTLWKDLNVTSLISSQSRFIFRLWSRCWYCHSLLAWCNILSSVLSLHSWIHELMRITHIWSQGMQGVEKGSGGFWKLLDTPLVGTQSGMSSDVLEWGTLLTFSHFANYPAKGMVPIVMICPYDFPLTE